MEKRKRIAAVEWIRVFAAFTVIAFHFEALYFGGNSYFKNMVTVVDFFFIFSGFLLIKATTSIEISKAEPLFKEMAIDSLKYSFRKAKGFYPAYITAFFLVFVLTTITSGMTDFGEILSRLFHFKWEILLLQMGGFTPSPAFDGDYLVGSAWYLSSMLLMMIPVYYLARYHRRLYIGLIAPLSALFIYCFMMQTYQSMDIGNEVVLFTMSGNLRAFAGLSLGCICYAFYENANSNEWSEKTRKICNIIEPVLIFSLPCLIIFRDALSSVDLLLWVPIYTALIFFSFSNKTVIARFLNSHFTGVATYLGRLSLYTYLFHWFFVLLFVQYFPGLTYWPALLMYAICVILLSALMMRLFSRNTKA